MAKIVVTKELPETLGADEIVISLPDYMSEIKASHRKASGKQQTSVHHLREIVTLIAEKYDKDFNIYASIPYSNYEGVAFSTDEDLSKFMLMIINKHCPELLKKSLDYAVKNRPISTKLIYFTGPESYLPVFFSNGITLLE